MNTMKPIPFSRMFCILASISLILAWAALGLAAGLPPQPRWVEVATVTDTSLIVGWYTITDSDSPATSFIIERRHQGDPTFSQVTTVAAVPSKYRYTYWDKNLPSNECYYYRIVAANSAGKQTPGSAKMGCTYYKWTTPAEPSDFKAAVILPESITFTWKDNADNETKYKLTISASFLSGALFKELPANTTQYIFKTYPEVPHWVSLQAMNSQRASAPVGTVPVATYSPPLSPVNLTAKALDQHAIKLTWTSRAKTAKTVKIESRTPGGQWHQIVKLENNETTYTHSAQETGTTHQYRVRMSLQGSDSPYSNEASATTLPPGPMNLRAVVAFPTQVDLAWNISSGAQETKIFVKGMNMKAAARPIFAQPMTVPGNITVASVTLANPGQYQFFVKSVSGGVESEPSNTIEVDTTKEVSLNIVLIGHNWTGDCPNNGLQALQVMATAGAPVNIKYMLIKDGVPLAQTAGKLLTAGQNNWAINTPALQTKTTTYMIRIIEPVQKDSNSVAVFINCQGTTGTTLRPSGLPLQRTPQPSGQSKPPVLKKSLDNRLPLKK